MGLFDFFKGNTTPEITHDDRIPCFTYTMNFSGHRIRFVLAPYSELANYVLSGDLTSFSQMFEKYVMQKLNGFYAVKWEGQYVFIDKDNSMVGTKIPMFYIDKRLYDENMLIGYESMVGYRVSQMEKEYKSALDVRSMVNHFKNL